MTTSLAFVELAVGDWPASVAWYRDVFGLPLLLLDEPGRFALFQAGAGKIALKACEARLGGVLLAFEVADLPAELGRLAGLGVAPEGPVKSSPEGYRRAVVRDPDGYCLSLFDQGAARDPK
jgi:predicted enzyme related to lactoylglutathione lyase